ncbi:MAG: MalY/PatB family protein [Lachnospiraceae bacterium]|nr:MalY/PatB family protein [Lachnospiraceae bacterium]
MPENFDFDKITDRRGTNSLKWDAVKADLPMWVADMDFETAPAVKDAIRKRTENGIFGYQVIPDAWYDAYMGWWKARHGLDIKKEWLIFSTGVVPALSTSVRKFTHPSEKILVMTPVYNIFFNSIVNNGRRPVECPLIYDKEDHSYSIDWDGLEKCLSDPEVTFMIFCNPQNPSGRIWTLKELARLGKLARDNGVIVFSDEIHCDLTDPGIEYVPFISASKDCRDNCIMAIAPSKTFNIAGLHTAAAVIPEKHLRERFDRALNTDECAEPNTFAIDAAIAAFTEGGEWLDSLRKYIAENKRTVYDYIESSIEGLSVVKGPATYLVWIDISSVSDNSAVFCRALRKETGLMLSDGTIYGKGGERFVRMNLATQKSRVMDGLKRLERFVSKHCY